MDTRWREEQERKARTLTFGLIEDGVEGVALSYVDNAGITRVKSVPVEKLPHAAGWGVGMSPVFDVFCVDDSITSGRIAGGPGGDLRLYPDLDRLVSLAAQPGWAWAPGSTSRWASRSSGRSGPTWAASSIRPAAVRRTA